MIQRKEPLRIEDVTFPIEERDLFVRGSAGVSTDLEVDRYMAIVDVERERVLSIVSADYRLVTNAEAIALGRQCYESVFGPQAKPMALFNIVQPKTRSFCHIDYVETTAEGEERPEWFPFLRITNSYNRTFLLRFDVGFCRGICSNGMIFGKESIEFRFPHTRAGIGRTAAFRPTFRSLAALSDQLASWIDALRRVPVARRHVPALVCKALAISLDPKAWEVPKANAKLASLARHLRSLDETYAKELGRNAYAAFNVITDLATRPAFTISAPGATHRLQRRASAWAADFAELTASPGFEIERYLEPEWSSSQQLTAFAGMVR